MWNKLHFQNIHFRKLTISFLNKPRTEANLKESDLLVHNLGNWGEIRNWPPYVELKERRKKGAGHLRLVGGSFKF